MKKIIIMVSLALALVGLVVSTSCSPSKTPTITTNSLSEGTEGQSYSQTLQVHGGTPPYTWFAMATLPPGLQLDPLSGVISGTPLAGWGPAFVSFQVTDHTGMGSEKQLLITVHPTTTTASTTLSPQTTSTTAIPISFVTTTVALSIAQTISPTTSPTTTSLTTGGPIGYNVVSITSGPDDNLWFTEPDSEKIGEISPVSDVITEYNVPELMPNLEGIAAGSDGNIWFTESAGETGIIGKISPATGMITEYNLPHNYRPNSIVAGPDGSLWFSSSGGYEIGNINPATDVLTLYSFSTTGGGPEAMAFGPDGNLWFTESASGNFVTKIGKFSPKTGSVTEYTVPTSNAELEDMSIGPDGNLWFTEEQGKIAKISPETGNITEYNVPTSPQKTLGGIASSSDGNVWFTETTELINNIGKISPATGIITEYNVLTSGQLNGITAGPDGSCGSLTEALVRSIASLLQQVSLTNILFLNENANRRNINHSIDGTLFERTEFCLHKTIMVGCQLRSARK